MKHSEVDLEFSVHFQCVITIYCRKYLEIQCRNFVYSSLQLNFNNSKWPLIERNIRWKITLDQVVGQTTKVYFMETGLLSNWSVEANFRKYKCTNYWFSHHTSKSACKTLHGKVSQTSNGIKWLSMCKQQRQQHTHTIKLAEELSSENRMMMFNIELVSLYSCVCGYTIYVIAYFASGWHDTHWRKHYHLSFEHYFHFI